jgi:hypothetical protein
MDWAALITWLLTAGGGFFLFTIWLSQRRGRGGDVAAVTDRPAEQKFPTAVVGLHGVLAATTLVLVFLAAVGVGS